MSLAPTPAGLEVADRVAEDLAMIWRRWTESWGDEEADRLAALLLRLGATLQGGELARGWPRTTPVSELDALPGLGDQRP